MYTLVIVDMQPWFEAANDPKTIEVIVEEIRKAKAVNAFIIVLEYDLSDKFLEPEEENTSPEIMKELEGYENVAVEIKDRDDGSIWISSVLHLHQIINQPVKVCGINTDACVLRTVEGLDSILNRYPFQMTSTPVPIEILFHACNTDTHCLPTKKRLIHRCTPNVSVI